MRLLTKKEVTVAKNATISRDREEGLKLARRVDRLREVVSDEEASLAKFRRETIARIHEEVTKENSILEELRTEVKRLAKRRQQLLEPIEAIRNEAEKDRNEARRTLEEAERLKAASLSLHAESAERLSRVRDDEKRVATLKDRASSALTDVFRDREAAKASLADARAIESRSNELAQTVERDLRDRDIHMAVRERDAKILEDSLTGERKRLDAEWKLLNDRKAMFERNLKRKKL